MTATTFVLDTSVLLSSPTAIYAFDEHEVVLPLIVLKELERKRVDPVIGHMARAALRMIDDLAEGHCSITAGMPVNDAGGTLRVEMNHVDDSGLDAAFRDGSNDSRILAVAHNLAAEGGNVVLVSQDLPLRLLAMTAGIEAQSYQHDAASERAYTGIESAYASSDVISELYNCGSVEFDTCGIPENTGVIVSDGSSSSALARVKGGRLVVVRPTSDTFGIIGRSAGQRIALAQLNDSDIDIVSLGGPAGTGKTVLALAAGLESVIEQGNHEKVIVFRNMYAVGQQELGFLPGTEEEKMSPWAAAVWDAVGAIASEIVVDEVQSRNLVEVLPLTHLRGRTLNNAFIIIEEAQNLDRSVLLTALSRLGEGSKAVLCWDVAQRDNLRVGRYDGIAAVVEKLKGNPLFSHTTLTKSERSRAAAMVAELIDDGS